MDSQKLFDQIRDHSAVIANLEATSALLEWDERTGLPSKGGAFRADQITLLSGMIHNQRTDPKFGDWLDQFCENHQVSDDFDPAYASAQKMRRTFEKNRKLPVSLVKEISNATVLGQQAWEKARAENDWSLFKPHLTKIFELRRQEAECLRENHQTAYDALLDQYEEGGSSDALKIVFSELREELIKLLRMTESSPHKPTGQSIHQSIPIELQRKASQWIAEAIGFDFGRGKLDETTHPFCTTLGPHDCRILTRYQEDFFPSGFYGTLHEAGHGLYEQGLRTDAWYGLPAGSYCSLGIHESQSRLWENFVGRSQAFWSWCFPKLREVFGAAWDGFSPDQLFFDTNQVGPSMIRVEADEVTYNLHIMIRFEIEEAILHEDLSVDDAPDAWNEKMQHYLGITPASYSEGILQDVHWSAGLIGYFPTYSLGNIFAAQLVDAAEAELGELDPLFAAGDFTPLLQWLQKKVHHFGACIQPTDLVKQATSHNMNSQPLIEYLRNKLTTVYQ